MLEKEDKHLVGKEIQTHISDSAKSRLKSKGICQVLKDEKQRPFRAGPSPVKNKQNDECYIRSESKCTFFLKNQTQSAGKRRFYDEAFFNVLSNTLIEKEFCHVNPIVKQLFC